MNHVSLSSSLSECEVVLGFLKEMDNVGIIRAQMLIIDGLCRKQAGELMTIPDLFYFFLKKDTLRM